MAHTHTPTLHRPRPRPLRRPRLPPVTAANRRSLPLATFSPASQAFKDFVSINGIMMMTSTTVSYAYAFVDGMPGASKSKGFEGEGGDPRGTAHRSAAGTAGAGCGAGCGAAASEPCCCCGGGDGGGGGGGCCGAMRCALTYVGLGGIRLGRSADEHLFAAKVTRPPNIDPSHRH